MSKVIAYKNLPAKLPVTTTIAFGLLLDRLDAPGWLWGVIGTIQAILFIISVIQLSTQKETDVVGS